MLRQSPVITAFVLAALAGCVDVPDGIRAQFAAPGPQDRSNYRPGLHGAEPPVAKSTPPQEVATTTSASADADAGERATDGGAP